MALKVFCPSTVGVAGGAPLPFQAIRCAMAVAAWLTLKNFGTPSALAGHQSQRTTWMGTNAVTTTWSAMLEAPEPDPTVTWFSSTVMPV